MVVQWRLVQRRVLATRLKSQKKPHGWNKVSGCKRRKSNFAGSVIENRYFMILVLVVRVMLRDRTSSYTFTLRTFMDVFGD